MNIEYIKNYLKKNKITYETLAKKANIPLTTLKQIFSGKTKNPRVDTINSIISALELENEPIAKAIDPRLVNNLADKGIALEDFKKLETYDIELITTIIEKMLKNTSK